LEKEDEMLTLQLILADGVTIKLGSNVWTLDLNFIIYLIVAAVVGLVAEALVGRRLPFGFVGAIIAALIGVWLLTKVIIINGIGCAVSVHMKYPRNAGEEGGKQPLGHPTYLERKRKGESSMLEKRRTLEGM
jgi:uncharacterized membrane protein YeaQ/YmgE (transglycosylase-associated protein family)